jgi:pimeloyl-[acyl-carrier protein] methyl ester esterase
LPALEGAAELRLADSPGVEKSFDAAARALGEAVPPGGAVCGWSLGALLAMRAARLWPGRFGALILVGATPCFVKREGWDAAQPAELLRDFAAAVAADAAAALRHFVALFNQGDAKARAIVREIGRGVLSSPPPPAGALLAGLDWLRDVDLRGCVPEISCPALLIHGERDPLMPLSAGRWLAEKLPRARLEVFAGAAHAPFLNDPERFARRIGEFLRDGRLE